MPIWLIGLLPKLLPFMRSKAGLIIGASLVAALAGWTVNGWRLDSKYSDERADRHAAVSAALAERDADFRAKLKADRAKSKASHEALMDDLAQLRARNAAVFAEIDAQPLTKPENANAKKELQNPFSDHFVDVWNGAAVRVRNDD